MIRVERCFDSHLHLLATGLVQQSLDLHSLHNFYELKQKPLLPQYFRGEWLWGFGWDEYKLQIRPSAKLLDEIFPHIPVALVRADGHAIWLNSIALKKIGRSDHASGVFVDAEKIEVDAFIPGYSSSHLRNFVTSAMRFFLTQGFTHIRDMSSNADLWQILTDYDLSPYTTYNDLNFSCENIQDFHKVIREAQYCRSHSLKRSRVVGIKLYLDGALGSEGAFLSQNYLGTQQRGYLLWNLGDMREVISESWRQGFEISVHTIGDESADILVNEALALTNSGHQGVINIEHAELLRPETIEKMKQLQVRCHMQPCHWLTDKSWIDQKLGSLSQYIFQWKKMEENSISFNWGSDSPIEESSFWNNMQALEESRVSGIASVNKNYAFYHSHTDTNWGKDSVSSFDPFSKTVSVIHDAVRLF